MTTKTRTMATTTNMTMARTTNRTMARTTNMTMDRTTNRTMARTTRKTRTSWTVTGTGESWDKDDDDNDCRESSTRGFKLYLHFLLRITRLWRAFFL